MMGGMDHSDDDMSYEEALRAALDARRHRLREYADLVLEAVTQLPMPKTQLEGERSARCITATDKMLQIVFSEPKTQAIQTSDREASKPRAKAAKPHKTVYVDDDPFGGDVDEDDDDDIGMDEDGNLTGWRKDLLDKIDRLAKRQIEDGLRPPHPGELDYFKNKGTPIESGP